MLCILGGENGEETVKVENIQMITPTIGVVAFLDAVFVALRAKPIPSATVNVHGDYLVDLKTIQAGREARIDVRMAKEVESNLEHFENMAFMRMLCIEEGVQLRSIEQVKKIKSDGPGDDKFSLEPLWGDVLVSSLDR